MLMPMISLPGVPPTAFLGILGITSGITAWVGVHAVARPPRRGETALVSGATGATGSVAAQLAKVAGARTIGVAGGPAKAAYCTGALGLAGCVDYKAERPAGEQLDELCPDGIDFYFDTVGIDAGCRSRTGTRDDADLSQPIHFCPMLMSGRAITPRSPRDHPEIRWAARSSTRR